MMKNPEVANMAREFMGSGGMGGAGGAGGEGNALDETH